MESAFSTDRLYGPVRDSLSGAPAPVVAMRPGDQRAGDPHEKGDKGPDGWYEDPVIWLVLLAALGTGIIGFRFHWGPGARASASVDVGDEAASLFGHAFFTMAVILIFKVIASKVDIPALQETAQAL